MPIEVHPKTNALRPTRIDHNDVAVHYPLFGLTAPDSYLVALLKRMETAGMMRPTTDKGLEGEWFVDLLDEIGDILDTLPVTEEGFQWLRMARSGAFPTDGVSHT